MKKFDGHLYETMEDWHPVVVRIGGDFLEKNVYLPLWLSEYCPDGDGDYDAWCHPGDTLTDPTHRTVYFFRDERVAILFALRWS